MEEISVKKILSLLLILMLLPCWVIAEENSETTVTSAWKIDEFVDEFDLPIGEYYITTDAITGTFSNSFANKEEVTAYIRWMLHDENSTGLFFIRLFEYGEYPVKNSGSNTEYYDVVIMDTDGNKYELEGYMPSGSNAIYFDYLQPYPFPETTYYVTDNDLIHNEMLSTGTIRFSITERDDTFTRYVIAFKNAGFYKAKKALEEMSGQ